MVGRISPSLHKGLQQSDSDSSRSSKKSVSFGDSIVHSVDDMSHEDSSIIWYNKQELDRSMQAERIGLWARETKSKKKIKNNDDDGFTTRGLEAGIFKQRQHVRHVVKIYRLKQQTNMDPEDLRKTSRHSSKHNAKFAQEQGRKDYVAVYGKGSLWGRAKARLSQLF